jgi:hypothetical protein
MFGYVGTACAWIDVIVNVLIGDPVGFVPDDPWAADDEDDEDEDELLLPQAASTTAARTAAATAIRRMERVDGLGRLTPGDLRPP